MRLRHLLAALLLGLVGGTTTPLYSQGPYAAQIQQAIRGLTAGTTVFTFLNVSSTSTTTTGNLFSVIYTGTTNPSNYYTNALLTSNITLANGVPFATGVNNYYRYAPTDSDASGSSRIATLSYLETRGSQNLSSFLYSLKGRVIHLGTGTVNTISGLESSVFNGHSGEQNTTGGNITNMYALRAQLFGQSTNSTIATEYGLYSLVENDNGAGVTTAYGVRSDFAGAVLPATSYAYYAGTVLGTTKYSFYASDTTAPSVFLGSVGVGGTPGFLFHITKSVNDFGSVAGRIENTNTGSGAYANWDVTAGTNQIRTYVPSQNVALQAGHITTSGTMSLYLGIGNQDNWGIEGSSGHLLAVTDNTYDIGKVGATRPRNVYLAGTYLTPVGSGMAVANVGANSCGTTAATIAGNNNLWTVTVGATSGTQCRIAFTVTATTEWGCAANDDTTTVAVRTTPVDTTHLDIIGTFTAGDKVTGVCFPR